jgi:hypothetical protein
MYVCDPRYIHTYVCSTYNIFYKDVCMYAAHTKKFGCMYDTGTYTGVHRGTQGYTGVHRGTQGYTGLHRGTQGFIGVHRGNDGALFKWKKNALLAGKRTGHTNPVNRTGGAAALVLRARLHSEGNPRISCA